MYKHYTVLYLGRHILCNLLPRFQVAEHHILHAPNTMKKNKGKKNATLSPLLPLP